MKIMTFNLRFENDRDGDNSWANRRRMVVDIINRYQPDILGTQEGKWNQLAYLDDCLPSYEAVMPGRIMDKKIQCPTLFVKKETGCILFARDFWLSKTPDVHLSMDWDSAFPRMISFAEIRIKAPDQKIIAAVTHLDHLGVEARFQQAKIIGAWVKEQEQPVVLMGDFNEGPRSRIHTVLTSPETPLCDTWKTMGHGEAEKSFTHHGFNGIPQLSRMDWILADCSFQVTEARIIHDQVDGRYPSDHFPYVASLADGAG
jgi:endonuclease/exonuclease/phosphatase family metal-dependent hydrolase